MNITERWEVIEALKLEAVTAANKTLEATQEMIKSFEKGVDVPLANRIISDLWQNQDYGKKLRTQLSAAFPEQNGRVLSGARMSPTDLAAWRADTAFMAKYFDTIHGFIIDTVSEVMPRLVSGEVTEENALKVEAYNDFRRNCLTYIAFIEDYSWEARSAIEDGKANNWPDLVNEAEAPSSVVNGDYLFIDDFIPRLREAQKTYVESISNYGYREWFSLDDIEWALKRTVPQIMVGYMFMRYLSDLLDE